jgi:hypothetical protein
MIQLKKIGLALAAPLLLLGCYLAPGKFTSTLTVDSDRSFRFTYAGELIMVDVSKELGDLDTAPTPPECGADENLSAKCVKAKAAAQEAFKAKRDRKLADNENKLKAIAAALSKEAGYRSAKYLGGGKFVVDYAISGKLDHTFLFPFNSDAQLILPFVMIEPRQNGTVRVRAPGYGQSATSMMPSGMEGLPAGGGDTMKNLDGVFTLDTNAELVSQNSEDGAKEVNGRRVIQWRATPLSKEAPSATLRFAH